MPHAFELAKEIEIHATPEEVWEAVATGPGIDGWFLGTGNEVEPRVGGTVRISFGEESGLSTVTAWDPPRHYAHSGEGRDPSGIFHAMEYTIEGRAGGTTVVRLVHSGFLADDWESEYDALNEGDVMYLHQLAQYVEHFLGRRASILVAMRPGVDREGGLATLRRELGVSAAEVAEGDRVRLAPEGVPPVEGVVDFVSPSFVGVRGPDALYRFMLGSGVAYLGHHVFRDNVDVTAETAAWQAWVDSTFA